MNFCYASLATSCLAYCVHPTDGHVPCIGANLNIFVDPSNLLLVGCTVTYQFAYHAEVLKGHASAYLPAKELLLVLVPCGTVRAKQQFYQANGGRNLQATQIFKSRKAIKQGPISAIPSVVGTHAKAIPSVLRATLGQQLLGSRKTRKHLVGMKALLSAC